MKQSFWHRPIVIFLFGPLIFLPVMMFTGSQISYGRNSTGKANSRFVLLLSAGALFYLVLLAVMLVFFG